MGDEEFQATRQLEIRIAEEFGRARLNFERKPWRAKNPAQDHQKFIHLRV